MGSVNSTVANSLLIASLSVGGSIEYPLSPSGMTTVYYNDAQTATRLATQYVPSGATGTRSFTWPYYSGVNQSSYAAAAHMFVVNPAVSDVDDAYYLINGIPTFLSNTNGETGQITVPVDGVM
jgi:hypothetical protein